MSTGWPNLYNILNATMLCYVALKCYTYLDTLLYHPTKCRTVLDVTMLQYIACGFEMFRVFVRPEDTYRNLNNLNTNNVAIIVI